MALADNAISRAFSSGLRRRRKPSEELDQGTLEKLGQGSLSALAGLGNILDTPGSMVRDIGAGLYTGDWSEHNPFDQLAAPWRDDNRISGRELNRLVGLSDPYGDDTTANWWGGFATELLTDPTTYLTFGASALTKSGKVARAAGLMDDLTRVAAKGVGPRMARMTHNLDDLVRLGGPEAREAAETAARGMGLAYDDIAKEALGTAGRFSLPIPFTDIGFNFGTKNSKVAAGIAKGLDYTGAAIASTGPYRFKEMLFNPEVMGKFDPLEQDAARLVYRQKGKAETAARKAYTGYVRGLHETWQAFNDVYGDELRTKFAGETDMDAITAKSMELYDNIVRMSAERKGNVDEAFGELFKEAQTNPQVAEKIRALGDQAQAINNEVHAAIELRGGDVKWIEGAGAFEHFPRYVNYAKRRDLAGLMDDAKIAPTRHSGMRSRVESIRTVPREIVNMIASDQAARGGSAAQHILNTYGRYLDDTFEGGLEGHADALAKWAAGHKEGEVFGNMTPADMLKYHQGAQRVLAGQEAIHDFFLKNLTDDASAIPLDRAVEMVGMKPQAVNYLQALAGAQGLGDIAGLKVPSNIVRAAGATLDAIKEPLWQKEIGGMLDRTLRFFRQSWTTPFPGFHFRNLAGGQYINAVSGLIETPQDFVEYGKQFNRALQALVGAGGTAGPERTRVLRMALHAFGQDSPVVVGLMDAHAGMWAENTGKSPEEWFQRIADIRQGDQASVGPGALMQPGFHGSPHTFDTFSTDKIGTGEGQQAFGWGLYFSDSSGIAEHYRAKLSGRYSIPGDYLLDGKQVEFDSDIGKALSVAQPLLNDAKGLGKTLPQAIDELFEAFRSMPSLDRKRESAVMYALRQARNGELANSETEELLADAGFSGSKVNETIEQVQNWRISVGQAYRELTGSADPETMEAVKILHGQKDRVSFNTPHVGQLYKVEIAPEDDELLMWNKPIRDQSPKVKEAIKALLDSQGRSGAYYEILHLEGGELYRSLRAMFSTNAPEGSLASRVGDKIPDDKAASLVLKQHGVRGIKYPAGSLSGGGSSAHNFVIFDDADVAITDTFYQQAKGAVLFRRDGKAIITAFKSADLSTFIHETGHIFRRSLGEASPQLLRQAEDALGVRNGVWDVDAEERFASAFERYTRDGQAPNAALKAVFQKLKEWMTRIYQSVFGTPLEQQVHPQLKSVFDQMLTVKDPKRVQQLANQRIFDEMFVNRAIDSRTLYDDVANPQALASRAESGKPGNPFDLKDSWRMSKSAVENDPWSDPFEGLEKIPGVKTARRVANTGFGVGARFGENVEFMNRAPMYLFLREKGWTPAAAAAKVRELHVDYSDLTDFERTVMKRTFSFYTWQRKMAPVMAQQLLERPGGPMAQTIRAVSNARDTDALTPDHVSQSAAIPNPFKTPSGDVAQSYITGLGLPFEAPLQYFDGGLRGMGRELMSQTVPWIKGPAEYITNQSFFQAGQNGAGRTLDEMDPTLGRILSNVSGQDEPVPTNRFMEQVLANSPLSRGLTTARMLTDDRKSPFEIGLNFLTGIKTTDINQRQQDDVVRKRTNEVLDRLGAHDFSKLYFTPEQKAEMDPQTLATVQEYERLRQALEYRARLRKAKAQGR